MEPGLHGMLDEITAEGSLGYKAVADAGELRELLLNELATLLAERFESTGRRGGGYVVPSPVTALVGRDRDVGEVVSLLGAQERRLVVLTGAGGVGNTRLGSAVLVARRAPLAGGVAFVVLSAVAHPPLRPAAPAAERAFVPG